jgi:hypothetical protein
MVQAAAPDVTSIVAAAVYHEAGWAVRFRQRAVTREEILLRPTEEADCEQAAIILEHNLRNHLPFDTVMRAMAATRSMRQRGDIPIEAQVLADADNLEEFGLPSLWLTIRRGMVEGKGVRAVLEMWQRRREYRFWDARLKDSFRFPPVRAIAERRLEAMERIMGELQAQHSAEDLASMLGASPADPWPEAALT